MQNTVRLNEYPVRLIKNATLSSVQKYNIDEKQHGRLLVIAATKTSCMTATQRRGERRGKEKREWEREREK